MSVHKGSESALVIGCRDCQHCIDRRGNGVSHLNKTLWITLRVRWSLEVYGAGTALLWPHVKKKYLRLCMIRPREANCWCTRKPKHGADILTLFSHRWVHGARRNLVVRLPPRVLFDGTHGLCVNTRTRLRDQERSPIVADLKRSMREEAKLDELTFALTADVSEAHRQVPIHPDDWHLLGCQVIPGGEVFINTVGTFGAASASYYWSRVSGAVGRLVADDYLLERGGTAYRLFRPLCSFRSPAILAQDIRQ